METAAAASEFYEFLFWFCVVGVFFCFIAYRAASKCRCGGKG